MNECLTTPQHDIYRKTVTPKTAHDRGLGISMKMKTYITELLMILNVCEKEHTLSTPVAPSTSVAIIIVKSTVSIQTEEECINISQKR